MYCKQVVRSPRLLLGAAAVACALFTGDVVARDHSVVVAVHVSAQGLDLNQPSDARTLYARLKDAAWIVCTRGTRVDLLPADDPKGCYEQALAGAIRAARAPTLTQLYLATHTLQEAVAHGIELPPQLVSK